MESYMRLQLVSLFLALVVSLVTSHSWIVCTDYLEMNGDYWNEAQCRAYSRYGSDYNSKNFGDDWGLNHQPSEDSVCQDARTNDYTTDYPMPVYYPGQTVVLTHPAKNHVAEVGCTNKYIPDSGSFVWRGTKDATSDETLSTYKSNVVVNFGVSPFGHELDDIVTQTYPKTGYQNVPKFCENNDKAMGTYNFTIPDDLQTGMYTFVWGWYFNSNQLQDLYTTCWEADVKATKSERDTVLTSRGQSTADPTGISGQSPSPAPSPSPSPSPSPTPSPSPAPSPASCTCECGNLNGCGAVTLNQP